MDAFCLKAGAEFVLQRLCGKRSGIECGYLSNLLFVLVRGIVLSVVGGGCVWRVLSCVWLCVL